jgi:hypothetical protein
MLKRFCRSEAESAELREFSEVEAAVVAERSAELEAAASQLHQQVEALAARLKDAYTQRDDMVKEVGKDGTLLSTPFFLFVPFHRGSKQEEASHKLSGARSGLL